MRTSTAAFSALALAALALTGCAAPPSGAVAGCVREDSAELKALVDVSGDLGTPLPDLDAPIRVTEPEHADLIVGDGAAVVSSSQNAIVTLMLFNGEDGQPLNAATNLASPDSMAAQFPGFDEALKCATAGSRVVAAIPAADLPEGLPAQMGVSTEDTVVGVFDVRYTLLDRAQGRAVFVDARGLPTVVRAADGRPGIIIPDADAPAKGSTHTLIEGQGEEIGEGAPMFLYTAVDWSDRTVTVSTWEDGISLNTNSVPEEVLEAISGSTVGSQLLVVVPGDDDATVYVVDVLGRIPDDLTGS